MGNPGTRSVASLCEALPPEEANRLAKRFEVRYAPKRGSWLDMAEMEIGVLMRQGPPKRVGSFEEMERIVREWQLDRNRRCSTVDWQFATDDAWVKPKRLCPKSCAIITQGGR